MSNQNRQISDTDLLLLELQKNVFTDLGTSHPIQADQNYSHLGMSSIPSKVSPASGYSS